MNIIHNITLGKINETTFLMYSNYNIVLSNESFSKSTFFLWLNVETYLILFTCVMTTLFSC